MEKLYEDKIVSAKKKFPDNKMYTYIGKDAKEKVVLVYNRNNLSKADFLKIDTQKWQLDGIYQDKGIKIEYCITVQGDFANLFLFKDKQIKIKGGINHFGVKIKRKGNKIPWEIKKNFDNVNCYIKGTGSYKNIRRDSKKIYKKSRSINIGHRPLEIYSGNSWWALHPYGGGSVRPR